jgi:dihydropteroate synthase
LTVGERTLVMGVLNITPDSFSDGGRFLDPAAAVDHGLRLVADGADLLDVGGESTRPGAREVDEAEELARTLPVVAALRRATDIPIAIDTRKAEVARRTIDAGADIINDVSALEKDAAMLETARRTGAGVVLMHMQGDPVSMQDDPRYRDAPAEVAAYLAERMRACVDGGLDPEALVLDPGIGFGKRLEDNLALIARLPVLAELGRPVLLGVSRKRFLGTLTDRPVGDRLAAGLGAMAYALTRGAHILRVHDVKQTCDLVRVVDRLRTREGA